MSREYTIGRWLKNCEKMNYDYLFHLCEFPHMKPELVPTDKLVDSNGSFTRKQARKKGIEFIQSFSLLPEKSLSII